MHKPVTITQPDSFDFTKKLKGMCTVFAFLGVIVFGFYLMQDAQKAWQAFLIGLFFTLSLSLGGMMFCALQYISRAGWSVNVRRIFESFSAFLIPAGVLFAVFAIFGSESLFSWMDPSVVAHDTLIQKKQAYLNKPFYLVRSLVFFAVWILFAKLMIGRSLKQDKDKNFDFLKFAIPTSIMFIVFFSLSYSFFSVDNLMSLDPHWFSTIFGVYMFSGMMQSAFAVAILIMIYLMKTGVYKGMVTEDHLHDSGKFLIGFTIFWAYIAYSQYMLIWYANIPEETIFYRYRTQGVWLNVSYLLLATKFIIPFLALCSRRAKRSSKNLIWVSILVIISQFIDLHWLVYPAFSDTEVGFSLWEVLIFLGFCGAFMFTVFRFLSKNSLIPMNDIYIKESASHEVTY